MAAKGYGMGNMDRKVHALVNLLIYDRGRDFFLREF